MTLSLVKCPATTWWSVDDLVMVTNTIDLAPYGVIPSGSKGRVVRVDPESLYTEILMDEPHRALHTWHNHLWVLPFDCEEIADNLVYIGKGGKWVPPVSLQLSC